MHAGGRWRFGRLDLKAFERLLLGIFEGTFPWWNDGSDCDSSMSVERLLLDKLAGDRERLGRLELVVRLVLESLLSRLSFLLLSSVFSEPWLAPWDGIEVAGSINLLLSDDLDMTDLLCKFSKQKERVNPLALCMLGNFSCFVVCWYIFSKLTFSTNSFRNTIRVS